MYYVCCKHGAVSEHIVDLIFEKSTGKLNSCGVGLRLFNCVAPSIVIAIGLGRSSVPLLLSLLALTLCHRRSYCLSRFHFHFVRCA